jgi:hypothetical protein
VTIILATTRLEPEITGKTIIFLYIFLIQWFKLPSDFVKKKKKRIRINYTGGFRYICPTSAWIWYLPCNTAPQSSLRVSETIYYTISSYCIKSVCSVLLKYSLFKIWILIKKKLNNFNANILKKYKNNTTFIHGCRNCT